MNIGLYEVLIFCGAYSSIVVLSLWMTVQDRMVKVVKTKDFIER